MPRIGQVLKDRYQLEERLGRDACRQTWLAIDLETEPKLQVVVKLLALRPGMPWDECKLFEREAQILQMLDHPQIPKYRDYFVLDQLPDSRFAWFSLVESYMPGKSLQQWLDLGYHFTETEVKKIAVEALTILVYLHELKPPVLHRDIKPSNLIWGKDQRVYLVDFGAVQDRAAAEGSTFTVVGTYGYVPMEQFGGRAEPASDLYALGATLIHLLTGAAPADLPQKDGRIQFGARVNLDLGLMNWINKLTEPNLLDRIRTARQALKTLNNRRMLSPPVTNCKPTGSQIQFCKSAHQLKIEIPRRGWKGSGALNSYALGGAIVWLFHLTKIIRFVVSNFNALDLDSVLGIGFISGLFSAAILLALLFPAFQQTSLYFNRKRFVIVWKVFGLHYWRRWGETAEIDGWKSIYADSEGRKGIAIKAKRRFTSSPMSAVERIWLIQEIRDWLDPAFRGLTAKPGVFADEIFEADYDDWIYRKEDFEEWT